MRGSVISQRILIGLAAGLVIGAVISEATYFFLKDGESRAPQVVELDIPPGTAGRVQAGQADPSLPASMTFVVGDTLVVKNSDSAVHQLGPLLIPPGSTASLKLDTAQQYAATCTFQPGRYLGLDVRSPLTTETRVGGILQTGIPLGLLFVLYGVFALPRRKPAAA
ncbi:MAG TPA: hypothetical protein VIU38_05065 [Anaerolineales bacterium]